MSVNPLSHTPGQTHTPHVPRPHDRADMRRVHEDLRSLFSDGDILEIMALMPKTGVLDLRTDTLEKALNFVRIQDAAGAIGIYVGTNPLKGQCGGPDKTRPNNQSVVDRRSLFLDFDRAETSKHLATHDELAPIRKARQHAQNFLATQLGFPADAFRSGVTGNGEYLIYQTDRLPNDAETNALIKRALSALRTIIEAKYPTVKLDTVTDAVRVRRISGTINRKHDDHRMCVLDVQDQQPLTRGMLEALAALAPVEERTTSAQSVSLSLDDQDIIERLQRKEKYRALLAGDKSGYSDYSSARWALASKLYWEHADEEQIERILRASDLFKESDSDRQRDHVARFEARKRASEGGPQRNPNYASAPNLSLVPPQMTADPNTLSCADVRAELVAAQAIIAQKDEQIVRLQERIQAADAKLERLSFERSQSMQVLRALDLNPGQKLTHFAQVIDLGARIANGEAQPDAGFRSPAIRVAEMTGQKVQAVRRHRKEMAERGIIQKVNVRERTEADSVDPETGEILTATGMREVTHIRVPDNNIINLIGPAIAYERPEDAPKRGGKRVKCQHHPDAGTITKWRTECAECRVVLEQGETYHDADPTDIESSPIKLEPEPSVVNTVYRGHISEPEPSHANFEPETLPFVVPLDFWDDPGPNDAARAAFYRGESA